MSPAVGALAARLLAMGEAAILVELAGIDEVLTLEAAIRPLVASASAATGAGSSQDPGEWAAVTDLVPGARTLLLITEAGADLDALRRAVLAVAARIETQPRTKPTQPPAPATVVGTPRDGADVLIPVVYDGPDLEEVSRAAGLSTAEVIAAHTGTPWRVGFSGFAPGFAYLTGGDPRLVVARRATPRTRVPAGSVGLAGEFSGIYPRESPGGWQLIGTTDTPLWDVDRDPPALLRPGMTVHFVATHDRRPAANQLRLPRPPTPVGHGFEVLASGPLTVVEDLGRVGYAAVGVGRSGAADRSAYRLGARLVGHREGLAAIEVTLGRLQVRARRSLWVALTGAAAPATVDGRLVPQAAPFHVRDGQVLFLGMPPSGLRTYVTVRGGLALPETLGSESTDTMSGLGPAALAVGDFVPVAEVDEGYPDVDIAPAEVSRDEPVILQILPGPRYDWFARPGRLAKRAWVVAARSDRVGVRLEGKRLRRHTALLDAELASEGWSGAPSRCPPAGSR